MSQTSSCPDAGLSLLSQNCKNLVKIGLYDCDGLTDASLDHIARIQSLQHLALYNSLDGTDAGVAALMRGCPNLRVLHICDRTLISEGFRGLKDAPFVDSLVEITIADEIPVADEPFDVIIGEGLARCHNLVRVDVSDDNFGDTGLALMCMGCPELEELTVRLSENLTIEGLMLVAAHCPRLRRCEVCEFGEFHFSDAEVEIFKARFPAIEFSVTG